VRLYLSMYLSIYLSIHASMHIYIYIYIYIGLGEPVGERITYLCIYASGVGRLASVVERTAPVVWSNSNTFNIGGGGAPNQTQISLKEGSGGGTRG